MTVTSYILGIASALLVIIVVIELLRRRRLRERHTLLWLLAGFIGLIVAVFPQLLDLAAAALGVEIPINLVFFLSIITLFFVLMQQSTELTKLEDRTRTLAEHTALIEQRLHEVEATLTAQAGTPRPSKPQPSKPQAGAPQPRDERDAR